MLISPEEIPKVALDDMNKIHFNEINILNKLYDAAVNNEIDKVDTLLEEFLKDVDEHFTFEQKLMEKYNFFAYPMHKGEHDRIRLELNNLKKQWESNRNPNLIKTYLESHFIPWLINHVQTMDTVTAMFLSNFIK